VKLDIFIKYRCDGEIYMKSIVQFILSVPGLIIFLWGFFCLLGGPDGKAGSLESIIWGGGFIVLGAFLIYLPGRTKK
jgi:hypothetical protein